MNTHRGHESQVHREAKQQIAALFKAPDWTVFFEQHNADIVMLHNFSGTIIAIEAECSPRNVLRNIQRNFEQGCHATATISINSKYLNQIKNKIERHLPLKFQTHTKAFGFSSKDLKQLQFWVFHVCQTVQFSPHMRNQHHHKTKDKMKKNKSHDTRLINRVELPKGSLNVDPAALQRARQGVPKGDLHNG